MKFMLLTEDQLVSLKKDISSIVSRAINEPLMDIIDGSDLKVKNTNPTEINLISKYGNSYADREKSALEFMKYFGKGKEVKDVFPETYEQIENEIEEMDLSVKDFHIDAIAKQKGGTNTALVKILIMCRYALDEYSGVKNQVVKTLFFKPESKHAEATENTKIYEFLPILIATEKIILSPKTGKYIINKKIKDFFLSDMEIVALINDYYSEKITEVARKQLQEQGLSIKSQLISEIKTGYIITSDKKELGKEIKDVGINLVKQVAPYFMTLPADKWSTFDILFVKDVNFHKKFSKIEAEDIQPFVDRYVESFVAQISAFNKRNYNYLAISMKISDKSQGGKATTYFNQYLKVKNSIAEKSKAFYQSDNEKRKKLFFQLNRELVSLIKKEKDIDIDFSKNSNHYDFWLDEDRQAELIKSAKRDKKDKVVAELKTANLDRIQFLKYQSMLFVRALFTGSTKKNFLNMINMALGTMSGLNPSYFKVVGKKIEAFDNKRLNMRLNEDEKIMVAFSSTMTAATIYITVPIKLTILDTSGNGMHKKSNVVIEFRSSGNNINPELKNLKLLAEQVYLNNHLVSEKVQEFLNKIE